VDVGLTAFAARGGSADVARFVNRVTATLSDLPLDRVAAERQLLKVEGAGEGLTLSEKVGAPRSGSATAWPC
jgi:zinc protease